MAENNSQTFGNHPRVDPAFHLFIIPVFTISLIVSIVLLVKYPGFLSAWGVVFALAAVIAVFKIRLYALRVQDRIIRLEERLRLAALLPAPVHAKIPSLTEAQLIALRFACDEELAELAERALTESLAPADIKKSVRTWRPDYWRV
jgi:hypothetical protein